MNYKVDRGGRIAVTFSAARGVQARRIAAELTGYRPPESIAELQTEIGFAALNLQATPLPRPSSAQQMDLSIEARHTLRDADHLIVLCDADATEDRFIDEEIRTFLAHHGGQGPKGRLHAVRLGEDAPLPQAVLETGVEPVADLGEDGEGWTRGLTLLRAAVLGVSADALERLEQLRSRNRAKAVLLAIGGVAAAAAVAAVSLPMGG